MGSTGTGDPSDLAFQVQAAAVPEPGTPILLGTGLLALTLYRRRASRP